MNLLPKDLLRLLLQRYLDPICAVRCFMASKMFNSCLSEEEKLRIRIMEIHRQIREREKRDVMLFPWDQGWLKHKCDICHQTVSGGHMCPLEVIVCPEVHADRMRHTFTQCTFHGFRQQVEHHHLTCKIKCNYCNAWIPKRRAKKHGSNDSINRCHGQSYGCFYNCGAVVTGKDYNQHCMECGDQRVLCPSGCGRSFIRKKLCSKETGQMFSCDMCTYERSKMMEKRNLSGTQATIAILKKFI